MQKTAFLTTKIIFLPMLMRRVFIPVQKSAVGTFFFDWIIFNNNRSPAKCWRFECGSWVHPPSAIFDRDGCVDTKDDLSSLPPFLWTTGTKFRRGRCFGAHCKKSQMKIFSITRALLFIWNKTKQMFYLCLFKSGTMFSQSSKPTLNIINVQKIKMRWHCFWCYWRKILQLLWG